MSDDTIGVPCPFTGADDLPFPDKEMGQWAGRVEGTRGIWYFHNEELETEGWIDLITALTKTTMRPDKAMRVVEILEKTERLKKVGDWWFVSIPQMPELVLPDVGDILIAQESGKKQDLLQRLQANFQTYLSQVRNILNQG